MRLVRVLATLALVALGIAASIAIGMPACDLRTGPELDARARTGDALGSGDGGGRDGGLFDAGNDAGLDAGMRDAGSAVDAMPDTPHF
jgi:hypothetical protein